MNDNDMANMIRKAQEMINNNQIPDELKSLVKNMQSNGTNSMNNQSNHNSASSFNNQNSHNSASSNNNQSNYNSSSNYNNHNNYNKYSSTYSQRGNNNNNNLSNNQNSTQNSNDGNSDFPNIDIETMMKLQNIMSKMKSFNNDDDMSKLLMSLKPYLRNEKKEKVDEYIKLIKMGKMTQAFDLFGGDKN